MGQFAAAGAGVLLPEPLLSEVLVAEDFSDVVAGVLLVADLRESVA